MFEQRMVNSSLMSGVSVKQWNYKLKKKDLEMFLAYDISSHHQSGLKVEKLMCDGVITFAKLGVELQTRG